MAEEAAKHGYKVISLSGDLDPAKQNNQLVDFAAQGYDAVFINPVNSTSVNQGIKKLAEAGIPVIKYHQSNWWYEEGP
jgi:ABC-type sugar transport system substrate-binding protein